MWPSRYSAPGLGWSPFGEPGPPCASASAATPARASSAAASAVTARGIGGSLEFSADRLCERTLSARRSHRLRRQDRRGLIREEPEGHPHNRTGRDGGDGRDG